MRKLYIEWLRIIAILLVIYNHSGLRGFDLYTVTNSHISFCLSMLMHSFCKIAVPVFLMISGVTLLYKEEDYKTFFKKRLIKQFFIIFLFGTLQYFRYVRTGKVILSLHDWIYAIYSKPIIETYWYLYLYLGFLLVLPVLRKVVKNMNEQDFFYLFTVFGVYSLVSFIGYFNGLFPNGHIYQLSMVVFYPLIGYAIDKYGYKLSGKIYACCLIMPLLISITGAYIYLYKNSYQLNTVSNVLQQLVPLMACGLFGLIRKTVKQKATSVAYTLITVIGSTVFGIYLIEDIVRNQVEKLFVMFNIDNIINDFLSGLMYTIISFVISVAVIYVLKKIPYLKNLI